MLLPYQLPTQTYAAGTNTTQTLRDLPKTYLSKIAHLAKIGYSVSYSPTWTSAGPDVVGNNNVFTAADFYDGTFYRFQGGFNHLRARQRMQLGHIRQADASTAASSTSSRQYRTFMHVGPPQFNNYDSDYLIPTGMLENGELRFTHGTLTNLAGGGGGTVSAASGTVRVTAFLQLLDEVRIPPAYQYVNFSTASADLQLPGRALYESIALVTGLTFAAFTNGQIGNVYVDLGNGPIIPNIKCNDLQASFADDFEAGELGVPTGDPESARDNINSIVDRTASPPTALAAPANDLQPVMWARKWAKISKMHLAETSARVKWDGSLSSVVLLIGRQLPQPQTVVATNIGKALGRLNVSAKSVKIKTQSKEQYNGLYAEFMPMKVAVG